MPESPVQVLTSDEIEELLAQPDRDEVFGLRDAAVLSTLYYGAATARELSDLDVRDIDLEAGEIAFPRRGGPPRRVPVEEELAEVLRRYLDESRRLILAQAGAEEDAVAAAFVTNRAHRLQVRDARQILGAHAKTAGLRARANLNILRLSRAWHLRESGESPEVIQRLLGTSSRSGRRVF